MRITDQQVGEYREDGFLPLPRDLPGEMACSIYGSHRTNEREAQPGTEASEA